MRYLFLVFAGLMLCNKHGYAQTLLANGSFEDENICTEYTKNCAPEGWICNSLTANYYFDINSWALEGRHFVGLIAGSDRRNAVRSFVRSRLLCGLRKGNQYTLSIYLRSRHNIFDSIGIYFSANDFLFEKKPYQQLRPSLVLAEVQGVEEAGNPSWHHLTFLYTATGDENFITIGSFKKQEYSFSLPPEINGNYYYYIDDVSLMPVNSKELPCISYDSMKLKVYEENERHYLLERKTAYFRKNPPPVVMPPVTIIQRIDTLIIPDILFATASAKLNEKSFNLLDSFSTSLEGRNIDSLLIEGHTDSVGTLAYNTKLSADRATAVSEYIHRKLVVAIEHIIVRYYAYLRPVASNHTTQGRQRNRRVEIYLYTHD